MRGSTRTLHATNSIMATDVIGVGDTGPGKFHMHSIRNFNETRIQSLTKYAIQTLVKYLVRHWRIFCTKIVNKPNEI